MKPLTINKDPTKLPCPVCRKTVDAGATWQSMKLLRRNELTCQKCGANLEKKGKYYFSNVALLISCAVGFYRKELSPWDLPLQLSGFTVFFALLWLEIKSVHLVTKQCKSHDRK
jgi:hypothetical protein